MPHFSNQSEEHYLKALYKLGQADLKKVNNTALAKAMDLNPATVLEMVRKLAEKAYVQLQPDKSLLLTERGKKKALQIVRKHRLWEVFLVQKLSYKWNEVHALAEQLEHVDSEDLVNRLDAFLDHPAFDPHGDPIPDKNGRLKKAASVPLAGATQDKEYRVVSFADTADSFLDYLAAINLAPGVKLKPVNQLAYDGSFTVLVNRKRLQLSEKVARNILVEPLG